ncbi:MAG: VCBS repeat-containing protein [Gemmatimonadota bacterium]
MPPKFRRKFISYEPYESAAFIDVNGDGVLDIVSGAWWYEGPDYVAKHQIDELKQYGEYYDDFSTIAMDINGNGRPDYVTGGWWGGTLRWRENPGDPNARWPEHVIAQVGNVETTRAWDVDGCGLAEVVPNTPGQPLRYFKLVVDGKGKGQGRFEEVVVSSRPQGHGLGAGDIAGHGRIDFVVPDGWYEAPADPRKGEWVFHPDFQLMKSASVPILVVDVNGDGVNEIIVGGGHQYGLDWWEQRLVGGKRTWIQHPIDPFNSQYHDMKWIDVDGDGDCELVTGCRWRAHCGRDPGSADPYGIYYFKWNGEGFSKQIVIHGEAGQTKGLGIFFDVADLTGNGRPDLLAPGKDGLSIFYNE